MPCFSISSMALNASSRLETGILLGGCFRGAAFPVKMSCLTPVTRLYLGSESLQQS
jgi:hypothetical protein